MSVFEGILLRFEVGEGMKHAFTYGHCETSICCWSMQSVTILLSGRI